MLIEMIKDAWILLYGDSMSKEEEQELNELSERELRNILTDIQLKL